MNRKREVKKTSPKIPTVKPEREIATKMIRTSDGAYQALLRYTGDASAAEGRNVTLAEASATCILAGIEALGATVKRARRGKAIKARRAA